MMHGKSQPTELILEMIKSFNPHLINYLNNETSYQIHFCVRKFTGSKSNFVAKSTLIGFEMTEKNVYKQTDRQTLSYLYR